jgi:hypothetical protein
MINLQLALSIFFRLASPCDVEAGMQAAVR